MRGWRRIAGISRANITINSSAIALAMPSASAHRSASPGRIDVRAHEQTSGWIAWLASCSASAAASRLDRALHAVAEPEVLRPRASGSQPTVMRVQGGQALRDQVAQHAEQRVEARARARRAAWPGAVGHAAARDSRIEHAQRTGLHAARHPRRRADQQIDDRLLHEARTRGARRGSRSRPRARRPAAACAGDGVRTTSTPGRVVAGVEDVADAGDEDLHGARSSTSSRR